jgi:1-acyl-sn-glycerol-3-phosphate acyltransferase
MFYSFLKVLVGITLRLFFRKIYITGIEHIKTDKAQLIASNHPNGFLEPLLMACFFPKPLHFLVRGDVFDNPFLKPILRATNQIPIFRFRDGFSKLRENSQTIDESLDVLINKNNLLIFAEGNTQSIKKLRPLQKGISRIAFQAVEKEPDLDLEILPVGINFTFPDRFDKTVMLRIGAPLKVNQYISSYHEDKNNAHQLLLNDLFGRMKKNVIHLENQSRSTTLENLLTIQRSKETDSYPPVFSTVDKQLMKEKVLAEKIDALSEEDYSVLAGNLSTLHTAFRNRSFRFSDLKKKPFSIGRIFILILGFMPGLIGLILHILPMVGGYWFTKKNVKQREFRASILMVSGLVLFIIQYIVFVALVAIFHLPWYTILVILSLGLFFRFYLVYAKRTLFKNNKGLSALRKDAYALLAKLEN